MIIIRAIEPGSRTYAVYMSTRTSRTPVVEFDHEPEHGIEQLLRAAADAWRDHVDHECAMASDVEELARLGGGRAGQAEDDLP